MASYRGKGRAIERKRQGNPCSCRRKYFETVPDATASKLFEDFWGLAYYKLQNSYLFGCIKSNPIKRRTKKRDTRRTCTISYVVKGHNDTYEICKQAFISIHGIGRGRCEYLEKKCNEQHSVPGMDQRGKHQQHKTNYSEANLKDIKEFINLLPKYKSHYSRNKNPGKLYMSLEYSIASLFEGFARKRTEEGKTPISCDKFRRIFPEEYNISFKFLRRCTSERQKQQEIF